MAEVVTEYTDVLLRGPDGRSYGARACGRPRADGSWEGWLEFVTPDGQAVRTGRETTQPSRHALAYWASGLTAGYLDGALLRAAMPISRMARAAEPRRAPAFEGPAEERPDVRADARADAAAPERARAVLDPFAVYAQGSDVLRDQLSALAPAQLRSIIRAYELSRAAPATLDGLEAPELVAIIVGAVQGSAA